MSKRNRIVYIEYKGDGLVGPARIGRVTYSKTGCTLYYGGKAFQSLNGSGFKANYFDVATGSTTGYLGHARTVPMRSTPPRFQPKSTRMLGRNTGASSAKNPI